MLLTENAFMLVITLISTELHGLVEYSMGITELAELPYLSQDVVIRYYGRGQR
jgi:hypothetical protein